MCDKLELVLQASSDVSIPIIEGMLQASEIKKRVEFKKIKVWDDFDYDLSWVIQKKADLSFMSLATAAKLFVMGADIKVASIHVWNNFKLVTHSSHLETFDDLKEYPIYIPATKFSGTYSFMASLAKELTFREKGMLYHFGYTNEELLDKLSKQEIPFALLTEPYASKAILKDSHLSIIQESASMLNSLKLDVKPLPDIAFVVNGDIVRHYPEEVRLLIDELIKATGQMESQSELLAKQAALRFDKDENYLKYFMAKTNYKGLPITCCKSEIKAYLERLNALGYIGYDDMEIRDTFFLEDSFFKS